MADNGNQHSISSRKKRKHKSKRLQSLKKIDGVEEIVLSHLTQVDVEAIVGKHVTIEKPWTYVIKNSITKNIQANGDASDFWRIRKAVHDFLGESMLLCYNIDKESEISEFFICTLESAIEKFASVIQTLQNERRNHILNSIIKHTQTPWMDLGSDKEVQEEMIVVHRSRIEVEIQLKQPVKKPKIQLRLRYAQEDCSYRYMELITDDNPANVITKSRQNIGIQVSPVLTHQGSQTSFVYPANASTKYHYEVPSIQEVSLEIIEQCSSHYDQTHIEDFLKINCTINFYLDDYKKMIPRGKSISDFSPIAKYAEEFASLIDEKLCKDKFISSISWHDTRAGIAAISYCKTNSYLKFHSKYQESAVEKTIYERNPVLIWLISNSLYSELIMDAMRFVTCLSFCPYNENLLIGGCVNGQIIIWDLKDTLNSTTNGTFHFRHGTRKGLLLSLLEWKENPLTPCQIPCTAVSNLRQSHSSYVVSIEWLLPNQKITNNGKIIFDSESQNGLQFVTAGNDGSICYWDLKEQLHLNANIENKTPKSFKRLKRMPEAIQTQISPFRTLHLSLEPRWKINIHYDTSSVSAPISSMILGTDDNNRDFLQLNDSSLQNNLHSDLSISTMMGEYISCKSVGFECKEDSNFQTIVVPEYLQYHDGPISNTCHNKVFDVVLTIGGAVFALWIKEREKIPIFWRKRHATLTCGTFDSSYPSVFIVLTSEGVLEIWKIYSKSKTAEVTYRISDNYISQITIHSNPKGGNIMSLADGHILRLFTQYKYYNQDCSGNDRLANFLKREVARSELYQCWKSKWDKRHSRTQTCITPEERRHVRLTPKPSGVKSFTLSHEALGTGLPKSNWDCLQNTKRIVEAMLTEKGKSDKTELLLKQQPLEMLKKENEHKKRKLHFLHQNAAKMSAIEISELFPDICAYKYSPRAEPQDEAYVNTRKITCYENYNVCQRKAEDVMKTRPFAYSFERKCIIKYFRRGLKLRNRKSK